MSSKEPLIDAEKLLTRFLPLVYRRPVEPKEVKAFVGIVKKCLDEKASFPTRR